ncbi:HAD family hydrolase [Peptoniphilus equinus]|uniref:HAD family hydrolase n=1 Tax=Peptoniphilus equinus TaxID=3016343 RepID=A0ABY7QS24_9FIRM|nr:HAD family hydrolase [Peptoniphilus equinus]WBW49584.1 HAD family hydrolase [Peptoniphilus equinus]
MTRLALFDFDKTLTTEDTMAILWRYFFRTKRRRDVLSCVGGVARGGLSYIHKGDFNAFKGDMVQILRHFSEGELEAFADYVYGNHMLHDGVAALKALDVEYKMLVSASPINYLKYFAKYLDFDVIIGTDLDSYYRIEGTNNKGYEKVRRIQAHLKSKGLTIDYDRSMAFSDSYKADRPMLELVANRYLINSKVQKPGYDHLTWR